MNSGGSDFGPLWDQLRTDLSQQAPTPGSRALCLHLRPAFEHFQVLALQQQTRDMQLFLKQHSALTPCYGPDKPDWFKKLGPTPQSWQAVQNFLTALSQWRQNLQSQQTRYPALWQVAQALQPESRLLELSQSKTLPGTAFWQAVSQRQSRWRSQQQILDQLGLIMARARWGVDLTLPRIGQKIELKTWLPARLNDIAPVDVQITDNTRVVLLTGAHQSGKTRLLQSLYLAALQHQSGLPLHCAADSSLPVFSGIQYFAAEQSLDQRLKQLKPLLSNRDSPQLILIDDFLTHSSPGENQALGRAVLSQLTRHASLTLASSHDHALARHLLTQANLRQLGLHRKGSRKQPELALLWDQDQASDLFRQAQQAGWPAALLREAEQILYSLARSQTPAPAAAPKSPAKAPKPTPPPPPPLNPLQHDAPVGSRVYLPLLKQYGELLKGPNRKPQRKQWVEVSCEGKTLKVPADQVVLSSHRKEKKGDTSGIYIQTWSVASESCDLHGLRVDEALPLLEKFLDTAAHQGLSQVQIIHGKGTSTLQQAVQTALRELQAQTDYIASFRLGHPGEGDSGVTIVRLK